MPWWNIGLLLRRVCFNDASYEGTRTNMCWCGYVLRGFVCVLGTDFVGPRYEALESVCYRIDWYRSVTLFTRQVIHD